MSVGPGGTPAGWYPDASNGGRQRYWDGSAWTAHFAPELIPAPTAPMASPSPVMSTAGPAWTALKRTPWLAYGAAGLAGLVVGVIFGLPGECHSRRAKPVPTVTVSTTLAPSPVPTVTVTETVTPAASPSATKPAPTSKPTKIKVPNGVGLDYQEAQDLWRAAGLVVLPGTDATGANRIPILDRNWVVLEQDLKPGTTVDDGSSITATIKKFTDD